MMGFKRLTKSSLFLSANFSEVSMESAFVGQRLTHAWHRSHFIAFLLSGCNHIAPNGQASTQAPQPMHFDWLSMTTSTLSFLVRASVGQTFAHGGSAHWRQAMGLSIAGSILTTRRRAFFGFKTFSWHKAQYSSQILHPVHLIGSP
jgi:hypothetical protein